MFKKILKWIGIGFGVVVILLVIAAGVLYFRGQSRFNQTYAVPVENVAIPQRCDLARARQASRRFAVLRLPWRESGGDRLLQPSGIGHDSRQEPDERSGRRWRALEGNADFVRHPAAWRTPRLDIGLCHALERLSRNSSY